MYPLSASDHVEIELSGRGKIIRTFSFLETKSYLTKTSLVGFCSTMSLKCSLSTRDLLAFVHSVASNIIMFLVFYLSYKYPLNDQNVKKYNLTYLNFQILVRVFSFFCAIQLNLCLIC